MMTDLTERLADVIADAAADHGTSDYHAQAWAAITWMRAAQNLLITTDQLVELARLRHEVASLKAVQIQPYGSCHACTNWVDETWRRADRKPPHVDEWDQVRADRDQLRRQLAGRGACCSHPPAIHTDEGCPVGWAYDTATGITVDAGCPCRRQGIAS